MMIILVALLAIIIIIAVCCLFKPKREGFFYWTDTPEYVRDYFNLKSCLFMAELADMAYYTNTAQEIQTISQFAQQYHLKFNPMNIYNDDNTQTTFIYLTDTRNRTLYISFRGTQLNEANLKTDLYESLVKYEPTSHLNVSVSYGFANAFLNLRQFFYDVIFRIQANRVIITGHSLGGALASLAAFDLKYINPDTNLTVYTFASPRVGDIAFASNFNKMVTRSYRVQNMYDPVPRFPTTYQGYEHVKKEILIDGQNCIINAPLPENYPFNPNEHKLSTYIELINKMIKNNVRCLELLRFPKILSSCTGGNTIPPYGYNKCFY